MASVTGERAGKEFVGLGDFADAFVDYQSGQFLVDE